MLILPAKKLIRNEIEVKRSRFITSMLRTETEDDARDFIDSIRKEFPDARHHCTAFVIHGDPNNILRSNDDGEPSQTAGKPMLEVLVGHELVNVTAVCTRYFGGTLLGTGGLVRAYGDSVSKAIELAPLFQLKKLSCFLLEAHISLAGQLESQLRSHEIIEVIDTEYTSRSITLKLACPPSEETLLEPFIANLTKGAYQLQKIGVKYQEVKR
ncbi:YigZ family protein [Boudabousia tangfeifanii]|uniref:YigZ family protein n=2 Tax=Boudabousia tangfeifanii TaxID=1912795 RepID=A0A1D9MMC4_9ACTO|nr:YigZ family protein [Boudabousia tangfeifanii]AOZ73442.1 YigZ family protein [Boudabousia tangfeifanii]